MRITVCSIPTLPNQYVVIANAVSLNQIVIYWQLTIVSDVSVSTNVVYTSSHLCSLQLHSSASRPIMFVADNA